MKPETASASLAIRPHNARDAERSRERRDNLPAIPGENRAGQGQRVLLVGDGIKRCASARRRARSMAPASGSDIGQAAADIVFTGGGLAAVVIARDVSVATRRLVPQNFALAIGYNAMSVPVAMIGHATPLLAAIAMSTSSIIVILNGQPGRSRTGQVSRPPHSRRTPEAHFAEPSGENHLCKSYR